MMERAISNVVVQKNPVGEAMSFARARQSQPDRLGTVRAFYAACFSRSLQDFTLQEFTRS